MDGTDLFTPFNVVPVATGNSANTFYRVVTGLLLRQSPGQLILEWPASAGNCVLQESAALGLSASWAITGALPQLVNGNYRLTVGIGNGNRYYRLLCAGP